MQAECRCECGHVHFGISGDPLFRAFCHCTICQEFNRSDFADIVLFRARDVSLPTMDRIKFKSYKQPPIVSRGKCVECGSAAIETLNVPLPSKLCIIPVQTVTPATGLPDPSFHMFYDRRVADSEDHLPKHAGYFDSQWAFGSALLGALFGARKDSR